MLFRSEDIEASKISNLTKISEATLCKIFREIRILMSYRVKHSKNEFANGKNHINGIENFWGHAKHRLSKFKGIKKENFLLHLKECEFRYNTKTTQENLYQKLLKLIRENPLKFN